MLSIADSFDGYAAVADMSTGNRWTTVINNGISLNTLTPFMRGQSVRLAQSNDFITKTLLGNEDVYWINCRFIHNATLSGTTEFTCFQLRDGTTPQVSIAFRSDGAIIVRSGDTGGTIQATFAGAFIASVWAHFQIQVIIHNTNGEVHIRKDNAGSDTFAATGINTRGGTANNYANSFMWRNTTNGNTSQFVKDIMIFDDNSASSPSTWTGALRPIRLPSAADTAQKDFTANTSGSLAFGQTVNSGTKALSANTIYLMDQQSATQGGTFTSLTIEFNAGFTGNAKAAIYLDDGDSSAQLAGVEPGQLIGVSNAVNNPGIGANVFTFATAISISTGTKFSIAILTDAAATAKAPSAGLITTYAQAYASGFPASLTGLGTQTITSRFTAYVTLTATNAGLVSDELQDGTTTYVSSPTVGHLDLYDCDDLPYTPSSIAFVQTVAVLAKSDAGAKTARTVIDSNGTQTDSGNISPATTFGFWVHQFFTDPDTSAAWTPTAINALKIGPKVQA